MRIVYRLSNGIVLNAQTYGSMDPEALDIFPSYNPTLHGTIVLSNAVVPTDFESQWDQYQVDSIPSPTAVVKKNHVVVGVGLPSSTQLPADGATQQTILIQIQDSSNVPVVTGSYTLNIKASKGFITPAQVTTVSGMATVTLFASKDVGEIQVSATDTDTEPITGLPSVLSGLNSSIECVSTATLTSPLDPAANSAIIPKPSYAQHCMVNFYHGKAVGAGIGIQSDVQGVMGTGTLGQTTDYTTAASIGDIAKFDSYLDEFRRRFDGKATFIFAPPPTGSKMWLGFSDSDVSDIDPTAGAALNGKSVAAIGVDTSSGAASFSVILSDGVITSTVSGFGASFKNSSATLYKLEIEMFSDATGAGFIFTLTKLAGGTGSSMLSFLSSAPGVMAQDNPFGIIGSIKATAASAVKFGAKSVYVQHI